MEQFEATKELLEHSNFYYIITTNMEGKYTYVNAHYANSFSVYNKFIVGLPFEITMHPDDVKVCEEVSLQCFANPGQLFPATIRKHNGKGGFVITQWEFKAIFDDNGKPKGIFCLGYDITKYADEQQQLKDAEYEIEKRKDILKEIAFQHSHLVRAPLSNILGLTDILTKMDIDTNIKNICQMILESSNQLDDIIKDVVGKSYK